MKVLSLLVFLVVMSGVYASLPDTSLPLLGKYACVTEDAEALSQFELNLMYVSSEGFSSFNPVALVTSKEGSHYKGSFLIKK